MAQAPIYQPGNPAPRAMPLPNRSAASFGADIGAGVEALGRAVQGAAIDRIEVNDRVAAIEDRRRLEENQTAAALDLARFRADDGKARIDARNSAAPGAAGHRQAVIDRADATYAELKGKYTDRRVVSWLDEQYAGYRSAADLDEYEFETKSRVTKQFDDGQAIVDIDRNNLFTNPSPTTFAQAIKGMSDTVDGWEGPAAAKVKFKRQSAAGYADSYLRGLAEGDPDKAAAEIASGRLNPFLDPESLKAISSFVGARQRASVNEAKAAERERNAQLVDQAKDYELSIDAGIPVAPDKLTSAIAQAAAAGKPELAERLRVKGTKNLVVTAIGKASPLEVRGYISDLDARIRANPNDIEARTQRQGAEEFRSTMETGLERDPMGWASRQGIVTLEPLTDAASAGRRAGAALKVQARYGLARVPVLLAEEVDTLKSQMEKGGDTRRNALGIIRGMAQFAPEALSQVAGNDAFTGHIAWLATGPAGVGLADAVFAGKDALKADPKLIDKDRAAREFTDAIGTALGRSPPQRQALLQTTSALYAARHGRSGEFDPALFRRELQHAAGATRRPNGDVQGGLSERGGVTYLVPRDMTVDEVERAIDGASITQWRKGLGGNMPDFRAAAGPSTGGLFTTGVAPGPEGDVEKLRNARLVDAADGRYFLATDRGGSQLLTGKDGKPVVLDIRQLGARR
ncbi:hypothetical protein [Sphingomonas sp. KC8]|uniref:hypothetical protein n=1 Tax=Sphingomonas sp. KC8 TaxID=1030157 RepID=UPI000248A438|nr:hypothetical protein [Sphingomonas sp. KC8]ARS27611.1 hypothetical protein KC8_09935 [Sphingomonas sp. KC8]